jgi:hypothetical protein
MKDPIKELINILRMINVKYKYMEKHAESKKATHQALYYIYSIGTAKLKFTENEKFVIGDLIGENVDSLQITILSIKNEDKNKLGNIPKYYRSALQFLLDGYSGFPYRGRTLKDRFENCYLMKESLNILDDINFTRDVIQESSENSQKPNNIPRGIPDTHIWWDL